MKPEVYFMIKKSCKCRCRTLEFIDEADTFKTFKCTKCNKKLIQLK